MKFAAHRTMTTMTPASARRRSDARGAWLRPAGTSPPAGVPTGVRCSVAVAPPGAAALGARIYAPSRSSSRRSSSCSSVTFSQTKSPARTMSGMTIRAARVIPRATATVLRAFMVGSSVRGLGGWGGSGGGRLGHHGRPEGRAARDELGDVVAGELGEGVVRARLAAEVEADDERAVLLEEEDVARLLLVHVVADHAQRVLVEARVAVRLGARLAAARRGFLHEPGDVVVEERERLLALRPERLRPRPGRRAGRHDALDDEPVGCFHEEDLAHPALVDEGPDRAEDLLEVLARTSLVDAHRASLGLRSGRGAGCRRDPRSSSVRSRSSGRTVRDPSPVDRSRGTRPMPRV